MSNYRRAFIPGGTFFFTVVTHGRSPVFASADRIALLRDAFRSVMVVRPFRVDAIVVLPDHVHCVWRLPEDDADFSSRWREIKKHVSRRMNSPAGRNAGPTVWQRRFWEHALRDEQDWRAHLDYVHYNPVKHGLVQRPSDWPWSSFHTAIARGWYPQHWGSHMPVSVEGMDLE